MSLVLVKGPMLHKALLVCCLLFWQIADSQLILTENKGQWPEQVAFRAELPSTTLWAESNALVYQCYDANVLEWLHPAGGKMAPEGALMRGHTYKVDFPGANPFSIDGEKKLPQYYNYYMGSDSTKWANDCKAFERCTYREMWPGIDMKLYAGKTAFKYDFVLRPGSNPSSIQMLWSNDVSLELSDGNLLVKTSIDDVIEKAPFAFQTINGIIHEVTCNYVLQGQHVHFELGFYNPDYAVVIDPELAFSTYIGSPASNFGFTACDDSENNLIAGAAVFQQGYPVTSGAWESDFNTAINNYMDIALSKFSNDGSQLLYSTYLGGSVQETPHSVIADSQDNFILMGVTGSNDFPTTAGSYQPNFVGGPPLVMSGFFVSGHPDGTDFIITKFNSSGAMVASTYVGGNEIDGLNYGDKLFYNYGDAFRGEVNVDENDNVFVASTTRGDFPMAGNSPQSSFGGGGFDGVVFKLNPNLSNLLWSSYFGGAADDACYAIEFSESGTIILAGGTRSGNFPHCDLGHDTSHNGDVDGFILKLDPSTFSLQNGTFVGTNGYDQVYFIQIDQSNNIYAFGQTDGDMPITAGLYGQANSGQFIRKYNTSLTSLTWNTTVGTGSGNVDISPTAFLVSDCEQIYISGWGGETNAYCQVVYDCYASLSTTFGLPVSADASQPDTDGSDFYLCVLSPNATELVYATYMGGSTSNEHVDGGTSRFNKNGSVYQAVCAGCQANSDWPTSPGAWSDTNDSFGCNLAVFRFNLGTVQAQLQIDGPPQVCESQAAVFINESVGANTFIWYFGDDQTSTEFEPEHIYDEEGFYTITLIATDDLGCLLPDTTSITIEVLPGVDPSAEPVEAICAGQQTQLNATGSSNLFWLDDPTLDDPTISNPFVNPQETTTYYLIDFNECETDTVEVVVEIYVPESSVSDPETICIGESVQLEASGGVTYSWVPEETVNNPLIPNPTVTPDETTTYTVSIVTSEGCEVFEQVTITVETNIPGGTVYEEVNMCLGNSVQLNAVSGFEWSWSPTETLSNPFVQSPFATPTDTTTYYVTVTNSCGTGTDEVTVNVVYPAVSAYGGGTICAGQFVGAWAEGAEEYNWQPAAYAYPPNAASTMLSPPESMEFTVVGIDENGCGAANSVWVYVLPLPPVSAGPDQHIDYTDTGQLFGNSFGLEYNWWPSDGLTCTDCPYPVATPESSSWYYLTVTDHNGCSNTDSVWVELYFPIYVPNTITANGDGINDYFRAYGDNIKGFHLQIFDRWGFEVFESFDIEEAWDGGINGYYVQNDSYVWIISFDSIDRRKELVGHVNVVR